MIHTAGRISKGAAEPSPARTAATVAGINWMDAVFITISLQSSSLADSPVPSAILCAARMPSGVAAFPKPRRLADIFPQSASRVSRSDQADGNSCLSMGARSCASFSLHPMSSITRDTPLQRQIGPASEMESVTPDLAPSIIEADITPVFAVHQLYSSERKRRPLQIHPK